MHLPWVYRFNIGVLKGATMKKIIIIGSGFGGLILGNLLAKKGHQVSIFESHSLPGGYTAGFYRNGFYFESGTLSFESSASISKAMKDIGLAGQIEFVKQRMRFVSDDYDAAPETYADLKKMYYAAFPSDKENLDRFFAELDRFADIMGSMDKPMPYLYSGLPLIFALIPFILKGSKYMKLLKKYQDETVSEFAARFFEKDSKLYRIFNGFGYPDMAVSSLAGAVTGILTDYWTVKTGMQSWADLLADHFQKLGGELKLNSRVDKIITKNGAAVGVSCKNTDYYADYVVSAADYKKTFLRLLDDKSLIPPVLQQKINNAPVSQGFFTVYLGLKLSNEALQKYLKIPHVMRFDEQPGYDISNSNDAHFFEKTSIGLYAPSLINPKLAPAGKSSLMLQTMVPYHWMDNWGNGDKPKYKQLKEQALKAMIKKAAQVIPGLENLIEYQDAATPLTYEHYTHNTDGATSSWNWNPKRKFYDQAMAVYVDTPVKNLYIGSCWAMQIGGIPGALAAAYVCAKKIR
jgi:phytoene dehydrogenase-like protein